MRSLLVQASSVEKAVEKAWVSAGMPTEFTIKILDFGEKGFLGITKKQAIVSIIYEPQKQTAVSTVKKQRTQEVTKRTPRRQYPKRQGRREQDKRTPRAKAKPKQTDRQQQQQQQQKERPERRFWSDSMTDELSSWITDISKIIGIQTPIKAQANKKALTVTFDGYALANKDEEKLLFSSLSYLLIQCMKKKHKKKYQGYQLIVTSKRFDKKQ